MPPGCIEAVRHELADRAQDGELEHSEAVTTGGTKLA